MHIINRHWDKIEAFLWQNQANMDSYDLELVLSTISKVDGAIPIILFLWWHSQTPFLENSQLGSGKRNGIYFDSEINDWFFFNFSIQKHTSSMTWKWFIVSCFFNDAGTCITDKIWIIYLPGDKTKLNWVGPKFTFFGFGCGMATLEKQHGFTAVSWDFHWNEFTRKLCFFFFFVLEAVRAFSSTSSIMVAPRNPVIFSADDWGLQSPPQHSI